MRPNLVDKRSHQQRNVNDIADQRTPITSFVCLSDDDNGNLNYKIVFRHTQKPLSCASVKDSHLIRIYLIFCLTNRDVMISDDDMGFKNCVHFNFHSRLEFVFLASGDVKLRDDEGN